MDITDWESSHDLAHDARQGDMYPYEEPDETWYDESYEDGAPPYTGTLEDYADWHYDDDANTVRADDDRDGKRRVYLVGADPDRTGDLVNPRHIVGWSARGVIDQYRLITGTPTHRMVIAHALRTIDTADLAQSA